MMYLTPRLFDAKMRVSSISPDNLVRRKLYIFFSMTARARLIKAKTGSFHSKNDNNLKPHARLLFAWRRIITMRQQYDS